MKLDWSGPDAEGIISAPGFKCLPFEHDGRSLEVRAVFDDATLEWVVALKEGDRFVAPQEALLVSQEKVFEARRQGGIFADLLPINMIFKRDAVLAGEVQLLDKASAPTGLRR
jgi:hypothetical protein